MKINKLQINGYGKIKNKEIDLKNKINLIYGENESGKSTIFKFILNMLYGSSKNKKGKDISDFEKYKPWYSEEFSGKIKYELDNKNKYEIYREFKRKNPKIYNENLEDISGEFISDKKTGINFFEEQTGIDEELFINSIAVEQENVKLEKNNENTLIQKITNLVSTGEDNISYKKTINNLNKKQLIEIGSQRSTDRPINKIKNEIDELKKQKKELINLENTNNTEENKNKLNNKIKQDESEIELIKKIQNIIQENKIENEKIKLQEENIIKNKNEINNLKNEVELLNKKIKIENNKKTNNVYIIFLILFFISLIINFKIKNIILFLVSIFLLLISIFFIFIYVKNKNKLNKIKNQNKEYKIKKSEIESNINLINKNIKEETLKIDVIKNNIANKIKTEKQFLKDNYKEINNIEELFSCSNINNKLEEKINSLNNNKLEIHKLELDEKNNSDKINKINLINHKINLLEEEYEKLSEKNKSIELAKQLLEKAYNEMRNNVTPKFTNNLSKIIKNISDNKYEKVRLNQEEGLIIEKENGEYISINNLSVGTIDQLYLAFRLSIIKEISDEKIPIILDESFAYYDEKRLENILKYFNENIENQIIIFTCTKREKEILEKNNIDFNYVEL